MSARDLPELRQTLVVYPATIARLQSAVNPRADQGDVQLDLRAAFENPPSCLSGYMPPGARRQPSDTTIREVDLLAHCEIPSTDPTAVRGARNLPCPDSGHPRSPAPGLRPDLPKRPLAADGGDRRLRPGRGPSRRQPRREPRQCEGRGPVADLGARAVGGAMRTDALKERLGGLRAWMSWWSAVIALATIGLLGVAGDRALAWQDQRQQFSDEKNAAAAASTEVEGLIDISVSTSKDDLDTLLAGATADFRSQLEEQADTLRTALTKNKVTATGDVVSAGVVKLDGGRATVIVAAAGTVQNKQTKDAEPRNYRLRVDLQHHRGRWLVSELEFVA